MSETKENNAISEQIARNNVIKIIAAQNIMLKREEIKLRKATITSMLEQIELLDRANDLLSQQQSSHNIDHQEAIDKLSEEVKNISKKMFDNFLEAEKRINECHIALTDTLSIAEEANWVAHIDS